MQAAWRQRHLFAALVRRQWHDRYAGSALGGAWALAQPLALLGLYALVFQLIFQVRLPQASPAPSYLVWLALGLWPWVALQECLMRGASAIVAHAALVQKVAFQPAWLVAAAVAVPWAVHALGHALVLALLALVGAPLQLALLWQWPLVWLAVGLWALGGALALASVQVYVRDLEQLLPQVLPLLMYASPVLYPLALVPAWLQPLMAANPLTWMLEPLRAHGLGVPTESAAVQTGLALGLGVVGLAAGGWVFSRLQHDFEDVL
ncbi:ABC transporter permease [Tepidimonas alkaliphilus]|uniref:ABC transporter permease n=1 Tax=Tepidimonas alkaliphilus TaxID=2588942 RepID=UPI00163D6593|nr:ABC transporter permease [Tepidimonas alkaliphilus]